MEQATLDKVGEAIGTVTFNVDPGIYKSVPAGAEPVKVVGDYTCIVVRGDLDDKVVYDLCKSMYTNVEMLAKGVKDIAELDPKSAVPEKGLDCHPGAVMYWKDVLASK